MRQQGDGPQVGPGRRHHPARRQGGLGCDGHVRTDGNDAGEGGNGITDASGVYQLKGRDKKVGVPAGDYKIVCQKMVMPDGSDFDPSKGASLADSDAKQILPPVFSDREQTTLKASVPAEGGNKFDFDVKSK